MTGDVCIFDTGPGESRYSAVRRECETLRQENEALQRNNTALKLALTARESVDRDPVGGDGEAAQERVQDEARSAPETPSEAHASESLHRLLRQSAHGSTPAQHSALELELMIRHPAVYPRFDHAEIDALASAQFQETRKLFSGVRFRSGYMVVLLELLLNRADLRLTESFHNPTEPEMQAIRSRSCQKRMNPNEALQKLIATCAYNSLTLASGLMLR